MGVSISVLNAGVVSEGNGAMRVTIDVDGELQTDITVTISTNDGTGLLKYNIIECLIT